MNAAAAPPNERCAGCCAGAHAADEPVRDSPSGLPAASTSTCQAEAAQLARLGHARTPGRASAARRRLGPAARWRGREHHGDRVVPCAAESRSSALATVRAVSRLWDYRRIHRAPDYPQRRQREHEHQRAVASATGSGRRITARASGHQSPAPPGRTGRRRTAGCAPEREERRCHHERGQRPQGGRRRRR